MVKRIAHGASQPGPGPAGRGRRARGQGPALRRHRQGPGARRLGRGPRAEGLYGVGSEAEWPQVRGQEGRGKELDARRAGVRIY